MFSVWFQGERGAIETGDEAASPEYFENIMFDSLKQLAFTPDRISRTLYRKTEYSHLMLLSDITNNPLSLSMIMVLLSLLE